MRPNNNGDDEIRALPLSFSAAKNNNNNHNNDNRAQPSPLRQRWVSKYSQWIIVIVTVVIIEGISNSSNLCRLDKNQSSATTITTTTSTTVGEGWVRPDVVYGLVHIAKTAGTEINGELATNYERVCGNKGYSYDYSMINREFKQYVKETGDHSMNWKPDDPKASGHFRGQKSFIAMQNVIGFDDCDYVASEFYPWSFPPFTSWKMELHVPCREPVDHLMSIYNHIKHQQPDIQFDCSMNNNGNGDDAAVKQELNKIIHRNFIAARFKMELTRRANYTVKCFDSKRVAPYLEYMDKILQKKRLQTTYEHRDSNNPRNRSEECLWDNPELIKKYRKVMLEKYDYYKFCDACMGSKDDLLAG